MVRAVALAVVLGAVTALFVPVPVSHADAGGVGLYEHPVDAEIIDGFRPPLTPFGPGNRGVKYGTEIGDPIHAASAGVVTFSGQVGGLLHVTVGHPDGRLTSYSGVGVLEVSFGERVDSGQVVARARGITHVGVRENGQYVDPEALFGSGAAAARLIPESPLTPTTFTTPGQEAAHLQLIAIGLGGGGPGVLDRIGGALSGAGGWIIGGGATLLGWQWGALGRAGETTAGFVVLAAPYVVQVSWFLAPYVLGAYNPVLSGVVFNVVIPLAMGEMPPVLLFAWDLTSTPYRTFEVAAEWWHHRQTCTPDGVMVDRTEGRRVAVLVGGLDSSSDSAGIGDLDTESLGYHDTDVVGFSYAGGRTPGRFDGSDALLADDLESIAAVDYGRPDSSTDLASRGELLADLLTEIAESADGATVDVYAHSQGGIVARLALQELESRPGGDQVIERLGLVATLATPHQGADLATIAIEASSDLGTSAALRTYQSARDTTVHPRGTNLPDLARSSELLRDLASKPLPDGPHYLSVAASSDYVVLERRTRLDGARQVTVPIVSGNAHRDVVGHGSTTRELELALGGHGPACRGFFSTMIDHAVSEAVMHTTASGGLLVSSLAVPVSPADLVDDALEQFVRW